MVAESQQRSYEAGQVSITDLIRQQTSNILARPLLQVIRFCSATPTSKLALRHSRIPFRSDSRSPKAPNTEPWPNGATTMEITWERKKREMRIFTSGTLVSNTCSLARW